MPSPEAAHPLDVVIVGGGVAGLETVMALRALAGTRVRIKLVTPDADFVYRPMSVAEPFGLGGAHRHPLDRIARDFDVELVRDTLDWVAPGGQLVFTRGGVELAWDALVLAMGARPTPAWDGVVTFTGSRDSDALRSVVGEIESGAVDSAAFIVPSGVTWQLPLYELALMTARRAQAAGVRPEIVVYTPEDEPLAVFGSEAGAEVAADLAQAGIRVVLSAAAAVTEDGVVSGGGEEPRRFGRIVALPRLEGPAPRGVPHDEGGFIPIDSHGLVRGTKHVYAAGDGTDFPIKQGGMAANQADAVAEVIAKRAGAGIDPRPFRTLLRGELLTGREPRFLHTDVGARARRLSEVSDAPLWWPAAKIAGVHLAPYLAALDKEEASVADPREKHSAVVYLREGFENNPWGE